MTIPESAQPHSHQGDQGGETSSALCLCQAPDFDSLGKKRLALGGSMKGTEGRGCPGGRCRLQIAGDRPLLPNPQHLSPEHGDRHPRLCPPAPPAHLPRPSRHIVLWGQVPHQTGDCAQGPQGLGVPSSPPSQPGSHLVTSIPAWLTPGQGGRAHSAPLSPPSWSHGHSLPCCAQPWMEAEPARFWLPYMNH